jgi:hypothetical protein
VFGGLPHLQGWLFTDASGKRAAFGELPALPQAGPQTHQFFFDTKNSETTVRGGRAKRGI